VAKDRKNTIQISILQKKSAMFTFAVKEELACNNSHMDYVDCVNPSRIVSQFEEAEVLGPE
jgi:hypothetical protein